jgi:hypothetical protein
MLSGDVRYYILAISKNEIRLVECTRFSARRVDIQGLPENLDAALNLDEYQKRLQRHAGTEDEKGKILLYFQEVDRGLRPFFRTRKRRFFSRLDYLFPIYRGGDHLRPSLPRAISGNPRTERRGTHGDAGPVMNRTSRRTEEVVGPFYEFYCTGRASTWIDDIVNAATHARIAHSSSPRSFQQWVTYDPGWTV